MKIPQDIRKKLHAYPNVQTVGWGKKYKDGKPTGDYAICVGVTQKISIMGLTPKEVIPKKIGNFIIDVQETGKIEAVIKCSKPWPAPPKDKLKALEFNAKYRPVTGGASTGHYKVSAGTWSCLVQAVSKLCGLSNNHVFANCNDALIGDPIYQPGSYDGGTSADTIAYLLDFVPIKLMGETPVPNPGTCKGSVLLKNVLDRVFKAIGSKQEIRYQERPFEFANLVDCALAEVRDPSLVTPEILKIGLVKGVTTGYLGQPVKKTGRTTEYTEGEIIQIEVSCQVDYGEGRAAYFEDQLMAGAMSAGGDSGSLVLSMDNYAVGLLFAGSEQTTIINKIQNIITALGIERFVDKIEAQIIPDDMIPTT